MPNPSSGAYLDIKRFSKLGYQALLEALEEGSMKLHIGVTWRRLLVVGGHQATIFTVVHSLGASLLSQPPKHPHYEPVLKTKDMRSSLHPK